MKIFNNNTYSVTEAIKSRRSIRRFLQKSISTEEIEQILELVRLTPSAWNIQPWHIHVIKDLKLKDQLQKAAYGQKQVTSAPVVFLITSDMEDRMDHLSETIHPGLNGERRKEELKFLNDLFENMSVEERAQWGLTQANIALGFLLIAIQGLGYASNPMLGFDEHKVKKILNLGDHVRFAAMVPCGHPDTKGYVHHRFVLDKIATFH
ncbi:nitroreductase family protein [Bacillus sp. JCM 19034]|uniref:nitroreductase family protein n=1 Tax=Bacillus sp. JCM 19034 TaxID=1481928 RepID=UPI0007852EDA|nr:nitroreductase family protein [Bacillus sp. JCM 19034]